MQNPELLTNLLGNFHFLRPWFIVLVPFILLIVWKLQIMLAGTNPWQEHIAPHLRRFMIGEKENARPTPSSSHRRAIYTLLGLMLIGLLGPTLWKKSVVGVSVKPQVMILLDQSSSMLVSDVKPSRHRRASFLTKDIISQLPDAAIGLIAYAGTEHPLVPITFTHEILNQALNNIEPALMPVQGSNASTALGAAAASLADQPEATLIWITDEIKAREAAQIEKQLSQGKFKTIIIGIGTQQGGPIELSNGQLLRDQNNTLVVPTYDQKALRRLAKKSGALFFDQKDLFGLKLQKVTGLVDKSASTKQKSSQDNESDTLYDKWDDIGPWFLLPAALLFASFFRKGFLFAFVLFIQPVVVSDLQARNQNQTAWDAYQAQDYEAALVTTNSLIEGAAHYQKQNYEAASQAWNRAANEYEPQSPEAIQAYYNLGNALAHLDNLEAAAGAYEQALEWQPDHEQAKFNLDLISQLLESKEQEKQQENQEEKEGQEQEEGQDGQESQDGQSKSEGQPNDSSSASKDSNSAEQKPADQSGKSQESDAGNQKSPEPDKATKEALEKAMDQLTQKDDAEKSAAEKAQEAKEAQAELEQGQEKGEEKSDEEKNEPGVSQFDPEQPEQTEPTPAPSNPKIDAIDLQPNEVLQRKMLRQYQLQQRQRGPTDDEPW